MLTEAAYLCAVSMIDAVKFGRRVQLVALVLRKQLEPMVPEDAFVEIPRAEFRSCCGSHRGWTGKLLDRLVEHDRVLERIEGAGRRPHAYRVNPTVGDWRVPWSVPREVALWRISDAQGLVARSMTGPQRAVAARSLTGPQPRGLGSLPRGLDRAATLSLSRGLGPRGEESVVARSIRAPQTPLDRARYHSLEVLSTSAGEEHDDEIESQRWEQVKRWIFRVTQRPTFGGPERAIRAAIQGVESLEPIERVIELQGPSAQPWAIAQAIELKCNELRDPPPSRTPPTWQPDVLEEPAVRPSEALARHRGSVPGGCDNGGGTEEGGL